MSKTIGSIIGFVVGLIPVILLFIGLAENAVIGILVFPVAFLADILLGDVLAIIVWLVITTAIGFGIGSLLE